jgi:hypothetical protein
MDNLVDSLQKTAVDLKKQEKTIDFSINALLNDDNKLRSYMILYLLAKKSNDALCLMKAEVVGIEKRLDEEINDVCKQAREILDGAETRAKWLKDIVDALGKLCNGMDLESRRTDLHNQMKEMEVSLNSLIKKRNEYSLEKLNKEE